MTGRAGNSHANKWTCELWLRDDDHWSWLEIMITIRVQRRLEEIISKFFRIFRLVNHKQRDERLCEYVCLGTGRLAFITDWAASFWDIFGVQQNPFWNIALLNSGNVFNIELLEDVHKRSTCIAFCKIYRRLHQANNTTRLKIFNLGLMECRTLKFTSSLVIRLLHKTCLLSRC